MSGITVYNGSTADGAGILVDASSDLTLTDVAVFDNHASSTGGGVRVSGVLTTDGVTFESNSSDVGGGIYVNNSGDATLINTTLSDNTAASNGGAIYTMNTVTITNSTIAHNNASGTGGIHRQGSGSAALKNTILANNGTNANGALTSLGYNIDSGSTAGFASTGDQNNTDPQASI